MLYLRHDWSAPAERHVQCKARAECLVAYRGVCCLFEAWQCQWCMFKPRRRRVRHLSVIWASDSVSSSVGALGQEMMCHPSELNFFIEYDSKNWTFLLSMTQRIELTFVWIRLNESIPFSWMGLRKWNLWLKNSQKFELFFQKSKLKIKLFFTWLEELNLVFQYDSKNWTLF